MLGGAMHQEATQSSYRRLAALKQHARQHGLSEDDTEDVLQQARIRYFQRRGVDYLDDAEPQPALMKRILDGLIIDHLRQWKRRLRAEQQFAAVHTACFEENALYAQLLGEEVLSRLPSKWRQVAYWRYAQGLSWQEIARRLKSKAGVISVQFGRALKKVCRELGIECRKIALSWGIRDGSAQRRKGTSRRRRSDAKAKSVADECAGADDSERGGDATHSRRPRRTRRGGWQRASYLVKAAVALVEASQ
ncbi:MAG: hypothetical protein CFK49_04100 [Armatimonadetes bacterium JP3_11]|nr:MAG: hypothetical protein CFK49_04100 [Armatimonadetes bacterium JP3_11]